MSSPGEVIAPSGWKNYRINFQIHSTQVRFRFQNTSKDETFKVRSFEVGYLPAGDVGVEQK